MRIYIITIYLLVSINLLSQQIDTTYISEYRHKIILNPWIGLPNYQLNINAKADTLNAFRDYVSNTRVLMGLDFSYRNISLSLGFKTPIYTNDKDLYGKSKTGSISIRYAYRKCTFEGKIGNYHGFAEVSKIDTAEKKFPFRQDLNTQIGTLGFIYTFKANKFSYGAAFNYSFRQIKSAWSPLLFAHAYTARLNADNYVLDTNFTKPFRSQRPFNRSNTTAIGIAPGITGTVVFLRNFFVTGFLCAGVDLQSNRLSKNRGHVYNSITANPFVDFRFAMGYNAKRFFTAITFKNENLELDVYKFTVNHSYAMFTIEAGYRLNTTNWIRKTYNRFPGF